MADVKTVARDAQVVKQARADERVAAIEKSKAKRAAARKGKHWVAEGCSIACGGKILGPDDEVTLARLHPDPAVAAKALERLKLRKKVVVG